MNLKKIEKGLQELFNKKMGLEFNYKTEDGLLEARQDLYLRGRQQPVDCTFWFFEGGAAVFCFRFDKIPYTVTTLDYLNKFNRDVSFLKANISSETLSLLHEAYIVDEKNAVEYAKGIVGVLVSDEVGKALQPLLDICDRHLEELSKQAEEEAQA